MIDPKDWKWYGFAGHFICGEWCRFHLCTLIGDVLVSTVGQMVHPSNSRGSERLEAEWLVKYPNGAEIGPGRTYETMAFKAGKPCEAEGCKCGQPEIKEEVDGYGAYNDANSATIGHMGVCTEVAERQTAARKIVEEK